MLAEVEEVVSPECVLATNTSSLSVTEMAAELEHPERVVGLHFFNPVAVLPLLEIVRGERTDDATLATAFAVGKALKKSCVLVKDAPAFVVNRLLTRFLGRGHLRRRAGTPVDVADRALDPLGLPMRRSRCSRWSARRWRCTWASACTRRSRTGSPSARTSADGRARARRRCTASRASSTPSSRASTHGDHPLTEEQVRSRAERRWPRRSG